MGYFISFILIAITANVAMALSLSPAAVRAIKEESWSIARAEAQGDGALKSYVEWRQLQDKDSDPSFKTLARFVRNHGDWPSLNRLQLRIEKMLFQSHDTSREAVRWLAQYPPISGYGMLAQARISGGNRELIRTAWIQGDFEREDEQNIYQQFKDSIDVATHRARAERLLLEGKASISERLLGRVGAGHAKLYRARIALQRKERNVDGKISAIPSSLMDDDGLLADRALWRHGKGLISGARELLVEMDKDSPYAPSLWRIRASYARDAIEAKQYKAAKQLLANAGRTLDSAEQADALWLKGWLEYTFLNDPSRAYEHFNTLFQSVGYPVSLARGAFWAAKAAQKNGNADIAKGWLRKAAAHPTTFYGQLAYAKLNPNRPLSLPPMPAIDSAAKSRYANHPLIQLAIAFYQADLGDEARGLLYHMVSSAEKPGEFAAMMAIAKDAGMTNAQVLIAKLAMRKHIVLADGWPIISPPEDSSLAPELALAISRQESEFNPRAVSRANARGLMQLLPSTARKVSKKLDLPYTLSRLFDPVYNMRLGSKYLADLISGFDDNYILAIAGYNAGPGRSRQWVQRFSWPGKDLENTLTFLELIPFSETRNYVQRVMENAQVYRARLKPNTPLQIEKDLLR